HMNIPAHFTVHIHISVSIHDTTPTAIYTLSLHDALPISYYGKNRLYHNRHGTFEEVAEAAGVAGDGKTWGSGCAFVDYDRDGQLDLVVANYANFDLAHAAPPGKYPSCLWKGIAVFCGPRGLPGGRNILYRNLGKGRF